jgi:hypothetical protein
MMPRALDTAISLVFVFATASLLCSVIVEWISRLLERRSQYLVTGLRNMLDDPASGKRALSKSAKELHDAFKDPTATHDLKATIPTGSGPAVDGAPNDEFLTASLFAHPMIRGLQTLKVRPGADGKVRNPQYIPSGTFARALIGTFLPDSATPTDAIEEMRTAVTNLPKGFAARESLLTLIQQSNGSIATLQRSIEEWYDAQMGRISGWYKRWAQFVLFVVGLGVALVLNLDTLQIGHTLWVDEPVRTAVVASVANGNLCQHTDSDDAQRTCAEQTLQDLRLGGVPIGYPAHCAPTGTGFGDCVATSFGPEPTGWALLAKLAGFFVTAFAISFGAPFWFETLSKLGSLRSTGPKPTPSSA